MTKHRAKLISELRERADRLRSAVSGGNCSASSQEWISPERVSHYYEMAAECEREALRIERGGKP